MRTCIDPKFRDLLHAFELDMLSESDRNTLEAHLLECESCFDDARSMLHESGLLRHNREIRDLIHKIMSKKENHADSVFRRIRNVLWPDNPRLAFIKPLIVLILLAAISYPVYQIGFHKSQVYRQTLNLFPMRGGGINIVHLEKGGDVDINFVFEDVSSGRKYILLIKNLNGDLVYSDSSFSDFNSSGAGSIILPVDKLDAGNYALEIADPLSANPDDNIIYYFKVK